METDNQERVMYGKLIVLLIIAVLGISFGLAFGYSASVIENAFPSGTGSAFVWTLVGAGLICVGVEHLVPKYKKVANRVYWTTVAIVFIVAIILLLLRLFRIF